MVIVTDFGADVQSYLAQSEARNCPRPAVCPHCGASDTLVGHGFYERQPTAGAHDYRIQIKRWYCNACHLTTSQLPSFLLRFRHYLVSVIQSVVVARFEQHTSWTQLSAQVSQAGRPASCTCRRWCQSFKQQALRWWAAVQQTLAQQDASSPVLDPLGAAAGPRDAPAALLHASIHRLAWAQTRWAEVRSYGLTERLRWLWHWGMPRKRALPARRSRFRGAAQGLGRLI